MEQQLYSLQDLKNAFQAYYMVGFPHQIDFDVWFEKYKPVESNVPVEQDKWISVEDKLPKHEQKILFHVGGNEPIRKGSFYKVDQWEREDIFCDGAFFNNSQVTHWQPLPSPPNNNQSK